MWYQDKYIDKFYTSNIAKIRDLHSNYKDYKSQEWHNGLQLDICIIKEKDNVLSGFIENYTLSKGDVFPLQERLFEDLKVFIPNDFDIVLKTEVDKKYMNLLPIKDRKPHEGRMDPDKAPEWTKKKYSYLYNP